MREPSQLAWVGRAFVGLITLWCLTVVIGGLVSSTILTLLVLPTVYGYSCDGRASFFLNAAKTALQVIMHTLECEQFSLVQPL